VDLLPDERVLEELPGLMLTNYRVRQFSSHPNEAARVREIISIRLEHVTHCQSRSVDSPAWILIGSLFFLCAFVVGIAFQVASIGWMGLIVFGIFSIIYLTISRCQLVIATTSATIKQTFPRKKTGEVLTFIEQLERETAVKPQEVKQEIVREIVYASPVAPPVEEDEETKERIVFVRPIRVREEADYWGG